MGIYDREYYRDETRGSGWFSGVAPACKTIILINVLVFVAQFSFPTLPLWRDGLAASSDAIFKGFRVWQLLTATFLHSVNNPLHIVWNMALLWVVGREMEAMYGSREFTFLYLTGAVFSTLCWAIVDQFARGGQHIPMLGASGAVMAVVVLYVLYYPRREVLLFFFLRIETWILLSLYLAYQVFMLLREFQGGNGMAAGTAFASHLGGALYGYLYKTFDLRYSRFFARRHRPRLRVISPDVRERDRDRGTPLPTTSARSSTIGASRPPSPSLFPEEQLDARLDEVLAKIAREGRGGLTEEDNHILQEASRRARDRRSDRV